MDRIRVIKGLSPYMGDTEHLSIFVNDIRLDILLSKINKNFIGLIPAWLDCYDDFAQSLKEKDYVWKQTKLSKEPKILPILLCPNDFDFSCTVIVVEVFCTDDTVTWNKFGVDITSFEQTEELLPKYIGKDVDWFTCIKPLTFYKRDYLNCISQFDPHFKPV